ncbi:TPA: hypothetical protein ACH3X1_008488 [Trebouxia sp. C0004]
MHALSNPDEEEGWSHVTGLLAYKAYCTGAATMTCSTARWEMYACQRVAEAHVGKDSWYSSLLFQNDFLSLPSHCCLSAVPVSQLASESENSMQQIRLYALMQARYHAGHQNALPSCSLNCFFFPARGKQNVLVPRRPAMMAGPLTS